jgi:hypothetical protein
LYAYTTQQTKDEPDAHIILTWTECSISYYLYDAFDRNNQTSMTQNRTNHTILKGLYPKIILFVYHFQIAKWKKTKNTTLSEHFQTPMKNLVDIDASNTHSERLIFDYWYEETRNTDRGNYYVYRIFGYNPFNIVWFNNQTSMTQNRTNHTILKGLYPKMR